MHRWTALRCALLASASVSGAAQAQLAAPAPVRQSVDANGVDLFAGTMNVDAPALTIGGADPQGLSYHWLSRGKGWADSVNAFLNLSGSTMTASFGGTSDVFTVSGSTYTPTLGNGASLTLSGTTYTYTQVDGTLVYFTTMWTSLNPFYSNAGRVTQIVLPSGDKLAFAYTTQQYCDTWKPNICTHHSNAYRINTVTNSYGYQLAFSYPDVEIDPDAQNGVALIPSWATASSVTATNRALLTGASTPTQSFGTTTSGANTYFSVTDQMSRVTKYRTNGYQILGVTLPAATSEAETITYTGATVSSVASAATGTTGYTYSDASGVRTTTVTDALSHQTIYKFDIASQLMTSMTDALGHTWSMAHDGYGRVTQVTQPEGQGTATATPCATGTSDCTVYTYDGYGNVTNVAMVPKAGSGLSTLNLQANYPCTTTVTCNKPLWTKDANLNQTDYTYDPPTGNVLTVTLPAPTSGAVRPQTRYSYTSLHAYYNTGGGMIVVGPDAVSMLTKASVCRTNSDCTTNSAHYGDETKVTTNYGPQTSGTGNNLLPVSTTATDGLGTASLTATTSC